MKEQYKNYRLVLTKEGFYSIAEVTYESDGNKLLQIEYHVKPNLGKTLDEAVEILQGCINDADNWRVEELREELLL